MLIEKEEKIKKTNKCGYFFLQTIFYLNLCLQVLLKNLSCNKCLIAMHILSNEELRRIYPESDGKPMAENTLQFEWIALIKLNLEACFAEQADVFIAADLFWYPVEGKGSIRMAPDVMVALGRPKGHRGSYLQFLEGDIPPQVVFEILSPGNRKAEMSRKLKFYTDYGVKEYYIYNPHKNHLEIYTRTRNELRLRDEVYRWTSPLLGIQFVWSTESLILYTPKGDPFLSYLELTDFHKQAIDALKESRALLQQEKKLLQLEIKRAQQETQRANEEAQRANEETQRANEEAQRAKEETLRANEEAHRAELAEQRLKTSIKTLAQAGVPKAEIVQLLGLSQAEAEKYL